ncbi:SEC-C domain-containing protein [Lachnospiraceae bacterium OttesenSCG-928-D06]|nr:SEC-C domain-containing protein [Lachnospiraceae bacterium OttesenSCG-928-D06]
MLLRERFEEYTKEELLDEARNLGLRNYSRLRKAPLIERIMEGFCTKDILRSRLACLTREQMTLFRKATDVPQDISLSDLMDSMQLYEYCFGSFHEVTDLFCIFEEVAQVFKEIDDEAFRAEQEKKGWMIKCVQFVINYYGMAPVEILHELYKLKVKDTIDEMIDMLLEMPEDILGTLIIPMYKLGMQDWPEEEPIYSARGIFIPVEMLMGEEFDYLLRMQGDKKFYIPSVQQIEELDRNGYEVSSFAYKKLETFFMKKMNMSYGNAVLWCTVIWRNSYVGDTPADVFDKMSEADVVFKSDKQMNDFLGLLKDAHNNTRTKENRGHCPNELIRKGFARVIPTIVPGSSGAVPMLREAAPKLREWGIPVDLDGNADSISTSMYPDGLDGNPVRLEKKVYPNDPCPCGSGKKYKKCCGRK